MSAIEKILRLADALDRSAAVDFDGVFAPSAAELRRLQAENERLFNLANDQDSVIRRQRTERQTLEAQRDTLLEVAQKYIAWSEAENDHKGTTFWERIEMCREVDELARAAIKAVEEGK